MAPPELTEYREYATCDSCGYTKRCRMEGWRYVCYSCEHGNFNGIKTLRKGTRT